MPKQLRQPRRQQEWAVTECFSIRLLHEKKYLSRVFRNQRDVITNSETLDEIQMLFRIKINLLS